MGKGVFYLQRRHLSSGSNDEDGERGKGCVRNSMATATARSARCVSVEEQADEPDLAVAVAEVTVLDTTLTSKKVEVKG